MIVGKQRIAFCKRHRTETAAHKKTPPVFTNGVFSLNQPNPLASASGSDILVPYSHGETSGVVAVIVVIDREDQAAVHWHARRQVAANQIRLTQLTVRHADVSDERADACSRDRPRIDANAAGTRTLWSDIAYSSACRDCSGSRKRDRIAGTDIDAGIGAARCAWHSNGDLLWRISAAAINVVSIPRAASPRKIVAVVCYVQTALAANLHVEGAASIGERATVSCEVEPPASVRREFSG